PPKWVRDTRARERLQVLLGRSRRLRFAVRLFGLVLPLPLLGALGVQFLLPNVGGLPAAGAALLLALDVVLCLLAIEFFHRRLYSPLPPASEGARPEGATSDMG